MFLKFTEIPNMFQEKKKRKKKHLLFKAFHLGLENLTYSLNHTKEMDRLRVLLPTRAKNAYTMR